MISFNPTSRCTLRLAAIAVATSLVAACTTAAPEQPVAAVQAAPATVTPTPAPTPGQVANPAGTLPAYFWALTSATGADGKPQANVLIPGRVPPTLAFQEGRVGVQNLCNLVSSSYRTDAGNIEISLPISTMRGCIDNAVMNQERLVSAQLPLMQRFEVFPAAANAPLRMLAYFTDGSRWELQGQPTPATKYGSAGERIFIEVAPEKVDCNHPLMPKAKCLRTREIRYDEKSIKRVVGDWSIFNGNIEGYNFEPGIRNILRVQRYDLSKKGPVPADASRFAYVLDMVVESERVR